MEGQTDKMGEGTTARRKKKGREMRRKGSKGRTNQMG